MKKQSSRARAQSTPPVRHQLEHEVPTVIHHPEEDMTALGRWAHHAMLEPGRYLGWPLAIVGVALLIVIVGRLATGGSSGEAETWRKLESARTPAERVEVARANPKSPAATWAMLQAATEFFNQALADLPSNRDVALPTAKKALDLFDDIIREAPHDSPQARVAALGKARVLEMRNELSRAIEQYQVVAKEWPGTPEAEQAARYAEALKDPRAAEFYRELLAYTPTKVTLPPEGTTTLPLPGPGPEPVGLPTPLASPTTSMNPPSDATPVLSPGLSAIPGIREVVEPKPGAPARPAPKAETQSPTTKPDTKAVAPEVKPPSTKPAPKAAAPEARPAPKAVAPEAKTPTAKAEVKPATDRPAAAPKQAELPADVFTPKAEGSKPR